MTMTDAIEPAGDAVERVARAMAESAGFAWEACAQEQWRRDARAGLAALPPAPASASARALREIDRLSLVIESAVRNEEPGHYTDVLNVLKLTRAALASAAPEQAPRECPRCGGKYKFEQCEKDGCPMRDCAPPLPEQAGEFAPRGLVAQYKLTAAEAACAELWAYIASLRAPIGLLASYQPTMDEMLAMRGELGDLIARVKRAADKPVPQNPGAALLGEFARGVEAAAKFIEDESVCGVSSQSVAQRIRALAREPETQAKFAGLSMGEVRALLAWGEVALADKANDSPLFRELLARFGERK